MNLTFYEKNLLKNKNIYIKWFSHWSDDKNMINTIIWLNKLNLYTSIMHLSANS